MAPDPSTSTGSSQTDADHQGTVPLRQYVHALIDNAASRIELGLKLEVARLDQRITQSSSMTEALAIAQKEAILKAEASIERRLEQVNEFRAQQGDMVRNLIPRAEADARFHALDSKIEAAITRLDKNEGQGAGVKNSWLILVAAIAAIGVLVGLINSLLNVSQGAPQTTTVTRPPS
jgi:hypothetical protein